MATHSSVLAWRIPGTGEPGGLSSMGSHRGGHDWSDLAAAVAAMVRSCSFIHLCLQLFIELPMCVKYCSRYWVYGIDKTNIMELSFCFPKFKKSSINHVWAKPSESDVEDPSWLCLITIIQQRCFPLDRLFSLPFSQPYCLHTNSTHLWLLVLLLSIRNIVQCWGQGTEMGKMFHSFTKHIFIENQALW